MTKVRADLGFADALEGFDPEEWTPKPRGGAAERSAPTGTREAAAAAGFRSREPQAATPAGAGQGELPRRRRTGRNAQFNLKARPETIAAFVAIADRQGWGLGETLEHAVAALEREVGPTG